MHDLITNKPELAEIGLNNSQRNIYNTDIPVFGFVRIEMLIEY